MIGGTVASAVKLQVMENKWQQKKNDINSKKPAREMTQKERMMAEYQEQIDRERESNSHATLYNKLKSGGRLTPEEISYLEQNDPESLRKYREDEAEKKAYERELKNCKTKDEVDRVKINKLGNFATQARNIANDPYIPVDKKLELMNQLNDKVCRVSKAHMEFIESEQYKDMPTEAELSEERAEETAENQEEIIEQVSEGIEKAEDAVEEASMIESNDIESRAAENTSVTSVLAGSESSEKIVETKDDEKEQKTKKNDTEKYTPAKDVDFQSISDSIFRFVSQIDNTDSRINISL